MRVPSPKPTLEGARVRLRPLGPGDAADLHAMTVEPELRRLTGTRVDFTRAQIDAWCAGLATRDDRVDLAIVRRADGAFLGEVVLNELAPPEASAAFRIALADLRNAGRGFGEEASRLLLDYGFTELGLHRVELEVLPGNARARRLYERLGFHEEGARREAHWTGTAYVDWIVMGLLRREWEAGAA